MRLFTAIDLSAEVRANIEDLQRKLKPAARLQWSSSANLHITTKFIGEWPASRLGEVNAALSAMKPVGPIEMAIRGFGWFPEAPPPTVFWVGIQAPAALPALAKATDDATATLGVQRETRPYTPHLTLARLKAQDPLAPLQQAIRNLPSQEFGSFIATRYHLYLSESSSSGVVYTKLADFSLLS